MKISAIILALSLATPFPPASIGAGGFYTLRAGVERAFLPVETAGACLTAVPDLFAA